MAVLVVVVGVPRLYLSSSFEGPLCYSCGSRGAVCAISGHTFTTRVVCTDKPAIMAKWRFHGVTGSPLHFMCTVKLTLFLHLQQYGSHFLTHAKPFVYVATAVDQA